MEDFRLIPRVLQWSRERYWNLKPSPYPRGELSWEVPRDIGRAELLWPSNFPPEQGPKSGATLRAGFSNFMPIRTVPMTIHSDVVYPLVLRYQGREIPFVVDFADSREICEAALKESSVYFKMQHRVGGYDNPKILRGGYFNNGAALERRLGRLHHIRDTHVPRFEVYGRFGLTHGREIRTQALALLNAQKRFQFEGSPRIVRYSESLLEISLAKVVVDLPGNGPLCMRLIDYLGIGSVIVAATLACELHVPLEHGRHAMFAAPDLSDLVDLCDRCLRSGALRRTLLRESRDYYMRYLRPHQLAAYYISHLLERATD